MNCLLIHPQSLCHPVLGDAKAVHAEYLDVKIHLAHSAKVGYVGIYCPSCPAIGFPDIPRVQSGIMISVAFFHFNQGMC